MNYMQCNWCFSFTESIHRPSLKFASELKIVMSKQDKQQLVLDLFERKDFDPVPIYATKITWIDTYPTNVGILPKHQIFSVFNKQHMKEATTVYNFLISQSSLEDFAKVAHDFKKVLNGGLYLYALSVALVHRADTRDLALPPMWQVNPYSFFHSSEVKSALDLARAGSAGQTAQLVPKTGLPIVPKFVTGTMRDPEYKLAWWREDVGFNAHHMHWHQVGNIL